MELLALLLVAAFVRLAVCETSEAFLQRHKVARGDAALALAPLYGTEHDTWIPNEYIVMLHPGYTLQEHFESIGMDLSNTTRFLSSSSWYRAKLDDITLNSHVRLDSGVLFVETNRRLDVMDPVESYRDGPTESITETLKRDYTEGVQQDAPYGLQMVSSAQRLPTPVFDHGEYDYVWGAGRGVNVYVFDTG